MTECPSYGCGGTCDQDGFCHRCGRVEGRGPLANSTLGDEADVTFPTPNAGTWTHAFINGEWRWIGDDAA